MHADYLEIKKKFLSHSKPYKEGSKKYNKTQKILNTTSVGNMTVRDEYKQLLSLARMWQTGKKSMDELANSMGQTEFRAVSSKIQSLGNIDEERLARTMGYTKADLDVVKDFVSAYRDEYKGPARHSALSHASMAGMPSNIRNTKGPRFTKGYVPSEKVPSNVGRLSAGSNALSGYKNNLDKKMSTMVQSGQQAAKHFNEYQAEAKMSNAASGRFMEALNDYNTMVRTVHSYAGNKAKFLKANIAWVKDELRNLYMITSCTLTPTDTDPGDQSWS